MNYRELTFRRYLGYLEDIVFEYDYIYRQRATAINHAEETGDEGALEEFKALDAAIKRLARFLHKRAPVGERA